MPKRILQGTVVSDKSDKTIVVSVTRKFMHPIYRKFITKKKNIMLMMKRILLKSVIQFLLLNQIHFLSLKGGS